MPNWTKGKIIGQEGGGTITFYYNPQTIETTKSTKWNHLPAAGREQALIQYGCGGPTSYHFDVDLSRTGGEQYVKDTIEKLVKLCYPTKKGAGVDRPPKVQLILGDALSQTCVMDEVRGKYGPIYDPQSLNPLTGKVTLKLTKAA